jgi:hypothetical protein
MEKSPPLTPSAADKTADLEQRLRGLPPAETVGAWHFALHTLTLLAREGFGGRFDGAPIDVGRNVCEAIHRVSSFLMTTHNGRPDTTSVDLLRWIEHRLERYPDVRESFKTAFTNHFDRSSGP